IDIGHGGKDRGAVGHENQPDQLLEKDANFSVGLKLYQNLSKAGAKVYLTRDKDIYYTLKERAYMANGINATIFVSIHNNSTVSAKPNGTETIYNTKLNKEGKSEMELYGIASKDIAKNVQKEMVAALGTFDRGTKNRPELGVVRRTKMPAIIVEGAFLSNEEDFAKMKQPDFAEKYARAVAQGIIKSMNEAYK
ncbi:MAG: N-acetylmuramoyl-L-alanine amidase family protein, partial [Eubacteriales bacterium]